MFKQIFIIITALLQFTIAATPDTSVSYDGETANYTLSYAPGVIPEPASLSIRGRLYSDSVNITGVKHTDSLTDDSESKGENSIVGSWKVGKPEDLVSLYIFVKTTNGEDYADIDATFSIIGGFSLDNGTQSTFSVSI